MRRVHLAVFLISTCAVPRSFAAPAGAGRARALSVIDVPELKKALKKNQGRAVLLHVWATWCLPCVDELPVVNRFAKEMKPRGLDVVSVSLDDPAGSQPLVGRTLRELGPFLTPIILRVDDVDAFIDAIDARWQGTIPAVFAYDRDGELRGSFVGEASRRHLDTLVGPLLLSPPPTTTATKPKKPRAERPSARP